MIQRLTLIVAMGLLLLVVAGPAQASSLVFVRGGDVWLTTPDHSREHRVTSGGGYTSATQSDQGTIVAQRSGTLYRMDQNGKQLNGSFGVGGVPIGIDLSPDGTKVAYSALDSCGGSLCSQIHITDSDRGSDPRQYAYPEGNSPAWLSNDKLMYTASNSFVYTTGVAQGTGAEWFSLNDQDADGNPFVARQAAITRAHDRLAVIRRPAFGPDAWAFRFLSTNGEPPAAPTPRCLQDFGTTEPSRVTWSAEGDALAWEQSDGVHVTVAPDLDTCAAAPRFVLAGATSPDYGPANLPAACLVPKLTGKKLAPAKKALTKARCRLGTVKKARSRKKAGIVIKQSIKAGKRLAAGTKVGVTVAKR